MAEYSRGDRVRIIRGSYAQHLYGTFVRYCGTHKACINVDGDERLERTLNRTSIRPVNKKDVELHHHGDRRVKPSRADKEETTTTTRKRFDSFYRESRDDKESYYVKVEFEEDDVESIRSQLSAMKIAINKMEVILKQYKKERSVTHS